MLVIDLRNSTAFLQGLSLSLVEAFIDDFSAHVSAVVQEVVGDTPDEWKIVKFTGDGFLIVFAEPGDRIRTEHLERARLNPSTPGSPVLGPARALAVARQLRDRAYPRLRAWNLFALLRDSPGDVGLASGIVDGLVSYGQLTRAALDHYDIGGEPVIRAFRFAQLRDKELIGGDADRILVCDSTVQEVRRFLSSTSSGDHPLVTRHVGGVDFQPVDASEGFKGLPDDVSCSRAIWPASEAVTA